MKTRATITQKIYMVLVFCLCAAPAAVGQAPQSQPPPHAPVSGTINVGRLSPEQEASFQRQAMFSYNAAVALHARQYALAESDARQALSLGQDSGADNEILAQALEAQGRDQEALQEYQTVVGGGQARNLLPYALLLLKSGQWAQALAVYNQALPNLPDVGGHPEDPTVHDSDLMQANNHFSPNVPDPAGLATAIHIAHGLVYNSSCDWASESQNTQAMAEYQQALQLAPNSALTNYYYGQGWQQLSPAERAQFGTAAQAKAALQKASQIGKGNVKKAAARALQVAIRMR